jgi:7-carboxy-7-deazaguanine synthase
MSVEDVLKEVSKLSPYRKSWVCITGGEPLWQEQELEQLVRKLKAGGYSVTIETNGSFKPPRWYTLVDSWNADIKCPSSQVCGVSNEVWFRTRQCDQIKFVVGTEEDLEFTKNMLDKHRADSPTILVSPVTKTLHGTDLPDDPVGWDREWLQRVVEFCLDQRVHFSLQWHKVVYGNKKGV